jgi:hypothetical protein
MLSRHALLLTGTVICVCQSPLARAAIRGSKKTILNVPQFPVFSAPRQTRVGIQSVRIALWIDTDPLAAIELIGYQRIAQELADEAPASAVTDGSSNGGGRWSATGGGPTI